MSHSLARDKVLCLIIKPVQGKERGGREGGSGKKEGSGEEREKDERKRERA